MGSNKKQTSKYKSAFHAAEVMSHDLSLLRGKKLPTFFDDSAILSHQNTQNSSYPAEEKDRVTSLQRHETLNGVCMFFSCLIPFNYFIFCRVFAVFLRK